MYDNFSLSVENIQMLVALANENWRDELTKSASPMFILSPTTIQVNLGVCKWKKDPDFPLFKIKGNLDQISVNISGKKIKFLTVPITYFNKKHYLFTFHWRI